MHGLYHIPEGINLEGAWGWGWGTSFRPPCPQGAALKKGGLGPHCCRIWRGRDRCSPRSCPAGTFSELFFAFPAPTYTPIKDKKSEN